VFQIVLLVLLCALGSGCATELEVGPEETLRGQPESPTATSPPVPAGTSGGTTQAPGPAPAGGEVELTSVEAQLLAEINGERAARGLPQVTVTAGLLCAARRHSEDIGETRSCSHTGSDGSQPGTRATACGADGWSGEIVACGQQTAAAAVDGWLGSPGHNAIMLDAGQRTIGVAMHENFWTAIFDK
jgi:uncharacterized protein YkwD